MIQIPPEIQTDFEILLKEKVSLITKMSYTHAVKSRTIKETKSPLDF